MVVAVKEEDLKCVSMFFKKVPSFFFKFFPRLLWQLDSRSEIVLSFDDGPHPKSTPTLLKLLDKLEIKACFFLLGKQAEAYPHLVTQIIKSGHQIGYHGYQHLSGWRTAKKNYIENSKPKKLDTKLFRPPYGQITIPQINALKNELDIVMWDVMPGDFKKDWDSKRCIENMLKNVQPGSIVVLHDQPATIHKLDSIVTELKAFADKNALSFAKIS